MKVAFLTLGCKVNSYETDKMKKSFEDAGYIITAFDKTADVYIVNTCTVTNIADRKSRQMLHKARKLNPDALVVAAGCYVDSAIKKGETDKSIDIFITNKNKEHITEIVNNAIKKKSSRYKRRSVATERTYKGLYKSARWMLPILYILYNSICKGRTVKPQ